MIIWTIQPFEFWEKFQEKRILHGDGRRISVVGEILESLAFYTEMHSYDEPDIEAHFGTSVYPDTMTQV